MRLLLLSCGLLVAGVLAAGGQQVVDPFNIASGQPQPEPAAYTTRIDGVGFDNLIATTSDSSGNVYAVGTFDSTDLKIDAIADVSNDLTGRFSRRQTVSLENRGGTDIFVVKYDSEGKILWARSAGGAGNDVVQGIAVDRKGNVFVGGSFQTSAEFGATGLEARPMPGSTFIPSTVFFAASLDSEGTWQWAKAIDYSFEVQDSSGGGAPVTVGVPVSTGPGLATPGGAGGFTADLDGNVYLSGYIPGSKMVLAGDPPDGVTRYVFMKFSDGRKILLRAYTSGSEIFAIGDGFSSVIIRLTDVSTLLPTIGVPAAPDIRVRWSRPLSTNLGANGQTVIGGTSNVNNLVCDANGNLFAIGNSTGLINVSGTPKDSTGSIVLRMRTSDGQPLFLARCSERTTLYPAVDENRNVYIAGTLRSSGTLISANGGNEIPVNAAAAGTIFLAKVDSAGDWTLFQTTTATAFNLGSSAAMVNGFARDPSGALYVSGYTSNAQFTFGTVTVGKTVGSGAFLAKLSLETSPASWAWAHTSQVTTGGYSEFSGIDLNATASGAILWGVQANVFYVANGVDEDGSAYIGPQIFARRSEDIDQQALTNVTATGALIYSFDYEGNLLPQLCDKKQVIAGSAIPMPLGVYLDGNQKPAQPEIGIPGLSGNPDTSTYFSWNPTEGKLYALRQVVADIRWRTSADILDSARLTIRVNVRWPTEYEGLQRHVTALDQPPVELEPAGANLTFSRIGFTEAGANVVGTKNLVTTGYGYSTLVYAVGANKAEGAAPTKIQVIRTYGWNDPAVLQDGGPVEIGKPIDPINNGHSDPSGRNGFMVNPVARFDGFGPQAAHQRLTRQGPIIPVNTDEATPLDDLVVIWYSLSADNIVWPSKSRRYSAVWPASPEQIVITSQLGNDLPNQERLIPGKFQQLQVYHQPSKSQAGYNPNEEHAMLAPSQFFDHQAIFALRNDLNHFPVGTTTSDPYVLLKYQDGASAQWAFKVYKVEVTAPGYPTFENFSVAYPDGTMAPSEAGKQVLRPYPLSMLPPDSRTSGSGTAYYKDHKGDVWARCAGLISAKYYYPLQANFWWDTDGNGVQDPVTGVPWLHIRTIGNTKQAGEPITVQYRVAWPAVPAVLPIGDTLLDARNGLPGVRNWASGKLIFDENVPALGQANPGTDPVDYSATMVRMFDPLSAVAVPLLATFPTAQLLRVGAVSLNVAVEPDGKYRFTDLPAHLATRLRYNKAGAQLEFSGFESGNFNGEPQFLINVMSGTERNELYQFDGGTGAPDANSPWDTAIAALYARTRDPDGAGLAGGALGIGLTRANGRVIPASVPGPKALTAGLGTGVGYVTLAENDDPALGDAPVALHVLKIGLPVTRGAIRLIKQDDPFSERIELRHSADFAGDPDRLTFEWYLQPVIGVTPPAPPDDPNAANWGTPVFSGSGVNQIAIRGPGVRTLADQWAFVRYKGFSVNARTAKEKFRVVCHKPFELGGRSFLLQESAGSVLVWFDIAGTSEVPAAGSENRRIRVSVQPGMSGAQVASALSVALIQAGGFNVSVNQAAVTVTALAPGIVVDAADVNTGFELSILQQGSAEAAESTQVACNAVGGLGGRSFSVESSIGKFRVWLDVGGVSQAPAPSAGETLLPVVLESKDGPLDITQKLTAALSSVGKFNAAQFANQLECEDKSNGAREDVVDVDTGFRFGIITQGGSGESLLSANEWSPWAGDPGSQSSARARFVEGWIKRVIQTVNPFEARLRDFRSATQTYSGLVQAAGQRFEGPVALSGGGDNLNQLGLIELYQTVLNRGLDLSINANTQTNAAVNSALLLAASRIADFYMILGNEAYADAQDPTVGFSTGEGVEQIAPPPDAFAFQNQLPSLMAEELALLRGRDDSSASVEAKPVYNRLFWNFSRGLEGEPLYVQTYAIGDQNADGFIAPDDAKTQFPQGHGDAWGHFLTATTSYYRLLRNPGYTWQPRAENTSILGVALQVDYLDEKKFAQAAAAKAKAGREIVELTYRNSYVADPAGQWQGYRDADEQRAWGVDDWAKRAGQAAYFDWAVANALLPDQYDPDGVPRAVDSESPDEPFVFKEPTLQTIDRTTVGDLREIASSYSSIQARMDSADQGLNPLGLAADAVPFDIDARFDEVGSGIQGKTHYEQIQERALGALANAQRVWQYANGFTQRLRNLQTTGDDFAQQVLEEETSYRNQLIEIFGYPYEGDIGAGKLYPSGYNGPDLYKYNYVNVADLSGAPVLPTGSVTAYFSPLRLETGSLNTGGFFSKSAFAFPDGSSSESSSSTVKAIQFPLANTNATDWSFAASVEMKQRRASGQVQASINEVILAQAELKRAKREYDNLIVEIEREVQLLETRYALNGANILLRSKTRSTIIDLNASIGVFQAVSTTIENLSTFSKDLSEAASESLPKVVGLAIDVFAPIRGVLKGAGIGAKTVLLATKSVSDVAANSLELSKETVELTNDIEIDKNEQSFEIQGRLAALEQLIRSEIPRRIELFQLKQQLIGATENYRGALAQGERLIEQRLIYRRKVAGVVQNNRYQDVTFRAFRNSALEKYRSAFDLAAQYVYLTAKAYDYETNLLGESSGSGQQFLSEIVRHRSLGQFLDGEAVNGVAGLSDSMARMKQNFEVLKGQLGLNNPNFETTKFSLRKELFRISGEEEDNENWRSKLMEYQSDSGGIRSRVVADLRALPEFKRYCRPFAPDSAGPQPALVIEFGTKVEFGLNFFSWPLGPGDNAYDPTQFTTKIRAASIQFAGYDGLNLSAAPRVYLVPVGSDFMLSPTANTLQAREFRIIDQRIPEPFPIGQSSLGNPNFIPSNDTLNGSLAQIRRHSALLASDSNVGVGDEINPDSRLVGRSVWNSRWMLIIPGATFLNDPNEGLRRFIDGVEDIELFLKTYSYSGN